MRLKFFIDPSGQEQVAGRDGLAGPGASRAGGTSALWSLGPVEPRWRRFTDRASGSHGVGLANGSGVLGRAVGPRLGGDAADGREEELQAIQGGSGE